MGPFFCCHVTYLFTFFPPFIFFDISFNRYNERYKTPYYIRMSPLTKLSGIIWTDPSIGSFQIILRICLWKSNLHCRTKLGRRRLQSCRSNKYKMTTQNTYNKHTKTHILSLYFSHTHTHTHRHRHTHTHTVFTYSKRFESDGPWPVTKRMIMLRIKKKKKKWSALSRNIFKAKS